MLRENLNRAIQTILKHYPADDDWSRWARSYSTSDDEFLSDSFAPAARELLTKLTEVKDLSDDERKEAFSKDAACRASWYLWRMGDPADKDGPAFCEMWVKEKTRAIHSYLGDWPEV